jgi:hypothetical protein
MNYKILSLGIALACLTAIWAGTMAAERRHVPARDERPARVRQVFIIKDDVPVKVQVGQIVRVEGMIPSGMGDISIETRGPARLLTTTEVKTFMGGTPAVGAQIKEFEVRAEARGNARLIVTIENSILHRRDTKNFNLEIQ